MSDGQISLLDHDLTQYYELERGQYGQWGPMDVAFTDYDTNYTHITPYTISPGTAV